MLPKTHILFGGIFSILLYFFFNLTLFETFLIFFASFLIDFDHYIWHALRKKDWNLKNAYYYLKNLKLEKPFMVLFHTIEFLLLILILSFFWKGFLFILIGMLFHSLLDAIDMNYKGILYARELSLIRYFVKGRGNYM